MRLFVGIQIPAGLRKSIADFQKTIKSEGIINANFVEPKNLHITLKFLGEVNELNLSKIIAALRKVTGIYQFEVKLAGLGGFPSKDRPNVLFISIEDGAGGLGRLRLAIDKNLAGLGFAPEKTYESHLTIARIKSVVKKEKLSVLFETLSGFGAFDASEFVLVKSILVRDGPVYEIIERFGLKNGG